MDITIPEWQRAMASRLNRYKVTSLFPRAVWVCTVCEQGDDFPCDGDLAALLDVLTAGFAVTSFGFSFQQSNDFCCCCCWFNIAELP